MLKVSVIIPMYNAERYIELCLESVKKQTLKDLEVIVINDGSTDNSLQIVQSYSSKIPNLRILNSKNCGAGHARNMGLAIAKGEYIKFLDADDELATPDTLKTIYDVASSNGSDVLVGKYYTHIGKINLSSAYQTLGQKQSGIINLEENKSYPFQELPGIGDKFFRREHIGKLRFPEMKWEDLAFTPVLMADAKNLYFLDEVVYNYRMRPNNTTISGCLFSHNILELFDVYTQLERNFIERGIKEKYSLELLGLLSMHGHFDASYVPLWINMPIDKKMILLKYFITKLEKYYPDFRNDKLVEEYYQAHSAFKKLFDISDFLASHCTIPVAEIEQEIKHFIKKK